MQGHWERGQVNGALLIWAHRGASAHAPENTLIAFQEAKRQGADGIELDVHPTRDGRLVVIHDATVQRTTQGFGHVADLTLAELRTLDAGYKFSPRFSGEGIPTLQEALDFSRGANLLVNIEIKTGQAAYAGIEQAVLRAVRETAMIADVVVSSFQPDVLTRMKVLDPSVETALLTGDLQGTSPQQAKAVGANAIHPSFRSVSPPFLHHALRLGLVVRPYTVNDERTMQRLAAWGVQGIITDDPLKARRSLGDAD